MSTNAKSESGCSGQNDDITLHQEPHIHLGDKIISAPRNFWLPCQHFYTRKGNSCLLPWLKKVFNPYTNCSTQPNATELPADENEIWQEGRLNWITAEVRSFSFPDVSPLNQSPMVLTALLHIWIAFPGAEHPSQHNLWSRDGKIKKDNISFHYQLLINMKDFSQELSTGTEFKHSEEKKNRFRNIVVGLNLGK